MTLKTFLVIIMMIESGGDPAAIGDNGNAVGAFQIWPIYVEDVNRIYGTSFTLADRYNKATSAKITYLYLSHYGSAERLGRQPTAQDWARIHNGGANGHKKHKTLKYYKKFLTTYKTITKTEI